MTLGCEPRRVAHYGSNGVSCVECLVNEMAADFAGGTKDCQLHGFASLGLSWVAWTVGEETVMYRCVRGGNSVGMGRHFLSDVDWVRTSLRLATDALCAVMARSVLRVLGPGPVGLLQALT